MQAGAQRIEAALAQLVASGADSGSVADAACSVCQGIAAVLSPIVGQQGVAALYRRSLHLTRAQHPTLSALNELNDPADFVALREALSRQTSTNAAAASGALLITFHDLLSSLIGPSLTERLLGSVLDKPSTNNAAQGPSS